MCQRNHRRSTSGYVLNLFGGAISMVCTRPDNAVGSRYMSKPGKEHWKSKNNGTLNYKSWVEYVATTNARKKWRYGYKDCVQALGWYNKQ
jgi:hypothetical protein